MPSSPSRPPAAEEVSDDEMSDGEVPPRQSAASLVRGAANRAAPGSAGEEEEEIYDDDDDESSDYDNSYDDDDESDESGSYYEDGEEEEEEGARGDRASGRAEEEEAAPAGVGGGAEAEGSPRAAATCCICMDSWASYGAHRICCIPCGHVYGRSCLERWLRRGGNTSAKCPQCSERFKHRHIINLYSSSVHLWNDCCLKEVQATDPSLSQRMSTTMTGLHGVHTPGDYGVERKICSRRGPQHSHDDACSSFVRAWRPARFL
ncbi:E3 ubiquitin-protein ligase RFWD3-like isoform X4 [Triticum dicoccoides]|uniref:E3 ubiquitin-protein ligase RFWD3-like isoform X4 n=1 Tax=Triticum dicoccoides TaxID=85692 RepID=UPI00188E899F|nr:E3 ubiquitin-protein ligase RFWD3-like isoform X4 [Triticum dicoccoides]